MLIPLGILDYPTGAAGAYHLLETQVLTSDAASVTFTGLDTLAADYQHLQIRSTVRSTSTSIAYQNIFYYANNDTVNTNFLAVHYLTGNGSSVSSAGSSANSKYGIMFFAGARDGLTTDSYGAGILDVLDFSNTNKNTTFRHMAGVTDSVGPINRVVLGSQLFGVTDAITQLEFFTNDNVKAGSRFSLYGIKGA
jgi:hypothetical protein